MWIMLGDGILFDKGTIVTKLKALSDDRFLGIGTIKGELRVRESDYSWVHFKEFDNNGIELPFHPSDIGV